MGLWGGFKDESAPACTRQMLATCICGGPDQLCKTGLVKLGVIPSCSMRAYECQVRGRFYQAPHTRKGSDMAVYLLMACLYFVFLGCPQWRFGLAWCMCMHTEILLDESACSLSGVVLAFCELQSDVSDDAFSMGFLSGCMMRD